MLQRSHAVKKFGVVNKYINIIHYLYSNACQTAFLLTYTCNPVFVLYVTACSVVQSMSTYDHSHICPDVNPQARAEEFGKQSK